MGLDHFKSGNNKCFWGWPSSHNPSCGGPPLCGPDFAATATLFFSREQVGFFVLQLYITLLVLYQSSLDFFSEKKEKLGFRCCLYESLEVLLALGVITTKGHDRNDGLA